MTDTVTERSNYFLTHILPWGIGILLLIILLIGLGHYCNYRKGKIKSNNNNLPVLNSTLLENEPINYI